MAYWGKQEYEIIYLAVDETKEIFKYRADPMIAIFVVFEVYGKHYYRIDENDIPQYESQGYKSVDLMIEKEDKK